MTAGADGGAGMAGGDEESPGGISRRQLIQGAGVAAGAMAVGAAMRPGEAVAAEAAAAPAAGVAAADPPVASGRYLTTNQGVRIADNQNTLRAGARGSALL